MSPEEALERLKRDIYLSEDAVRRRHYRFLRTLVQTDIYRLAYGGHPTATIETIADLCEELPRSTRLLVDPGSSKNL